MQRPIKIKDLDVVIFHKNCQDGMTASHIFKYECQKINKSLRLIPSLHEGKEIRIDAIKGKNIIMVDIATNNIDEIKKHANKLYILDHHKTAVDKYKDLDYCYFDMLKCGTTLAYEYVHENTLSEDIPKFIKCIESRDLWTWKEENSKEFTVGYYEKSFTEDLFELFKTLIEENDDKLFNKIIEFGRELIIKKNEQINKYFETVKVEHVKIKYESEIDKKINSLTELHVNALDMKDKSVTYSDSYYQINQSIDFIKIQLDIISDIAKKIPVSYCKNDTGEDIIYKIIKINADDELYKLRSDFGNYCMINLDIDFIVIYKHNEETDEYFCSLRSSKEKTDLVENNIAAGHPFAAGLTLKIHPDEHFINVG